MPRNCAKNSRCHQMLNQKSNIISEFLSLIRLCLFKKHVLCLNSESMRTKKLVEYRLMPETVMEIKQHLKEFYFAKDKD